MDVHEFFVEDQYMFNGIFTSCPCGWRGEVHHYRWIRENFPNEDCGIMNLGAEFKAFLEKEWEAHLKG